jgi:hypothetical protein
MNTLLLALVLPADVSAPPGVFWTISFFKGKIDKGLYVAAPLVVEGVLMFRLTALHGGQA